MRDAARALDDVSDHLGEVLRHADQLLDEWSRFGVQVRAQVEREAGAIGGVVDDAVMRAASAGVDKAIAERLSALTAEIGRLEQRTKAASRAVGEQRETDRRVLWIVAAGVVLANVLLVALWLRKPDLPPPAPEPVRVEPAPQAVVAPPPAPAPLAGSAAEPAPAPAPAAAAPEPAAKEPAKDAAKGTHETVVAPPKAHAAAAPHKKLP